MVTYSVPARAWKRMATRLWYVVIVLLQCKAVPRLDITSMAVARSLRWADIGSRVLIIMLMEHLLLLQACQQECRINSRAAVSVMSSFRVMLKSDIMAQERMQDMSLVLVRELYLISVMGPKRRLMMVNQSILLMKLPILSSSKRWH